MRSVAVVPGEVERQLVLECGQAERDDAQAPGAFALDRSDRTLNHRQAPIFSQSPESMPNPVAPAPAPESLLRELRSLVGNEVSGLLTSSAEGFFEESPYC
jgi:hypothetical protein